MTVVWGLFANHIWRTRAIGRCIHTPELAKTCKLIALDLREDWEERDGYWKCNAFSQYESDEVFYGCSRADFCCSAGGVVGRAAARKKREVRVCDRVDVLRNYPANKTAPKNAETLAG